MEHRSEEQARRHLEKLLEAVLRNGPQMVTRRGVETAVIVLVEEWRRLTGQAHPPVEKANARKSLKDLLLADVPRYDLDFPPRRHLFVGSPDGD